MINKLEIINETRLCLYKTFPEIKRGKCLYSTLCLAFVLQEKKIPFLVQAGSLSYPRLNPEQDDGRPETCTHFSFIWEPRSEATLRAIAENRLPEIHVWMYLPETMEIVDLTTHEFPCLCKEYSGLDWLGDKPPDYIWCKIEHLPRNVFYEADMSAINYVLSCMKIILGQK